VAEREAAKAAEEVRRMREREEKQKPVMDEFQTPPARTPEKLMQLLMQLVNGAAERGQSEVQVYRFPNALCSDRGRAINNSAPDLDKDQRSNSLAQCNVHFSIICGALPKAVNKEISMWWHGCSGRLTAGFMLLCVLTAGTFAQSARPTHPTGSVNIHQVQVAFIGSGAVGGGTLYFHGRSYPFKLGGLGIGGIGISTLDATGSVYNLKRLQDFNGVYGQARTGWVVGEHGGGQMWLQNSKGVYLHLRARRQGLSLSLGADGMVVRLGS
jgi:hypothetical protein